MRGDWTRFFAAFLLAAALTAAASASSFGGQASPSQEQPKKFGFQFRDPTGGPICFDGDGTVVTCPPAGGGSSGGTIGGTDTSGSDRRGSGTSNDASLMKKKDGHGDSWFCNLCHLNATSEVAGPRTLREAVMADPPTFWRRHAAIATLVRNKSVLTSVRDSRTLTPSLQRLMAARPGR